MIAFGNSHFGKKAKNQDNTYKCIIVDIGIIEGIIIQQATSQTISQQKLGDNFLNEYCQWQQKKQKIKIVSD